MASDDKIFLRVGHGWDERSGEDAEGEACRLSAQKDCVAVYWSVHTVVDQIALAQLEPAMSFYALFPGDYSGATNSS